MELLGAVAVFDTIRKHLNHGKSLPYVVSIMQKYRHKNTRASLVNYHFVWCPRRRRKVIVHRLESRLKMLISDVCKAIECEVIALETMPDHVHLFVNAPPSQFDKHSALCRTAKNARMNLRFIPRLTHVGFLA